MVLKGTTGEFERRAMNYNLLVVSTDVVTATDVGVMFAEERRIST
jgi:hypothetical protein